jgi:hypothetical protein
MDRSQDLVNLSVVRLGSASSSFLNQLHDLEESTPQLPLLSTVCSF